MLHPFHVSSGHRFMLQTKFVAPALLLTDGHKWQWRRAQHQSQRRGMQPISFSKTKYLLGTKQGNVNQSPVTPH